MSNYSVPTRLQINFKKNKFAMPFLDLNQSNGLDNSNCDDRALKESLNQQMHMMLLPSLPEENSKATINSNNTKSFGRIMSNNNINNNMNSNSNNDSSYSVISRRDSLSKSNNSNSKPLSRRSSRSLITR